MRRTYAIKGRATALHCRQQSTLVTSGGRGRAEQYLTLFYDSTSPRHYVLDIRGTQVHNALHLTPATSGRTAWESWGRAVAGASHGRRATAMPRGAPVRPDRCETHAAVAANYPAHAAAMGTGAADRGQGGKNT
jgi:hypothetical protein